MQDRRLICQLDRLKLLPSAFIADGHASITTDAEQCRDQKAPKTNERVQAEYVWIGGRGSMDMRSKCRTVPGYARLLVIILDTYVTVRPRSILV